MEIEIVNWNDYEFATQLAASAAAAAILINNNQLASDAATISGSDGCNDTWLQLPQYDDDEDTGMTYEKDMGVENNHEYNEDD